MRVGAERGRRMATGDAAELAEAGPGGAGGKERRRLVLLLVLGPLAIIGLLGAGAWGLGWFASGPKEAGKPAPVFYALPDFTVNLSSGERPSYLKMRVALEVPDRSVLQALEPQLPRIIDLFQVHLRELRPADLAGSAGLYRLREELVHRINLAIAPKSVNDVLFQEILIQ